MSPGDRQGWTQQRLSGVDWVACSSRSSRGERTCPPASKAPRRRGGNLIGKATFAQIEFRSGLSAGGDWIRTSSTRAREVGCRAADGSEIERLDEAGCRCASVTFDQLVPRTRAGGQGHCCARPLGRGPRRGRRFEPAGGAFHIGKRGIFPYVEPSSPLFPRRGVVVREVRPGWGAGPGRGVPCSASTSFISPA